MFICWLLMFALIVLINFHYFPLLIPYLYTGYILSFANSFNSPPVSNKTGLAVVIVCVAVILGAI